MDRGQVENLIGGKLIDSEGQEVGKIGMIYLDDQTNEPDWVTVNTGLFGTKETFVPLEGARSEGDSLRVAYTKAQIKDAPNVDADEHLDVEHEERLYQHYGRDYGTRRDGNHDDGRRTDRTDAAAAGVAGTGVAAGTTGRRDDDLVDGRDSVTTHGRQDRDLDDDSRISDRNRADVTDRDRDLTDRDRDRTGDAMTLHEERLNVGTERREAGTARLRKYVVSEKQSVTVPVTHEEVHVEREPIRDGRAVGDGKIGEEVQEVTLHEKVPVVNKETVATEQVRLGTERVTDQQQVSGEVRHEEVDVTGVEGRSNARVGRDGRDADLDADGRNVKDDRSIVEKAKDKLT